MRKVVGRYQPRSVLDCPRHVEILLSNSVFPHILREMQKHIKTEEGGKYIGYLFGPGELHIDGIVGAPQAHAILITDFLPGGPKAIRTAVEFRPDGEYQDRLFRELEANDPAIEHLGTWHSHHCNGLSRLSDGDVDGYFRTLQKPAFRLDFFIASLVKYVPSNVTEPDWIDHFLFVRGSDNYYDVTKRVKIIELPAASDGKTGVPSARTTHGGLRLTSTKGGARTAPSHWYETDEGRRVLAVDKRLFGEQFGDSVVATRHGSHVTLTGRIGRTAISMTYPANPGDQKADVSVRSDGAILEMSCELVHRRIALVAALAAAEALRDAGPIRADESNGNGR